MLVKFRHKVWFLLEQDSRWRPSAPEQRSHLRWVQVGKLAGHKEQTMRHGSKISPQRFITNTHSFISSFRARWRPKASKRHPSRFAFGKQAEKAFFGRGQRTMQLWQSLSLVPEGIECHMVPLHEQGQPGGGCGPQCMRTCVFVSAFCARTCA